MFVYQILQKRSMIIFLLFLSIFSIITNAAHFNGGTITWAPINPHANSSSVDITITQSYSWTYPLVTCATNVPVSSGYSAANLTCIANCSTDGGYSNSPIDILTDCISYSSSLGMLSSEKSVNTTLSIGAYFYIAYTGNAWRDLYYPSVTGLSWSIVTLINLHLRDDGIIDTPPVANIISPQYVIVNTTSLIDIPVSDANEGDDVRCRWAINNVNLSIDECSGICYPVGLPNNTILSNCTLSFTGLVASTWYGIALQVEDFMNETSTVPMSSVPVQFLIYVLPTPTCSILPVILPLKGCLEVEVGVTMNFTLFIMNLCNSTVTITDIIISQEISGMTAGSLSNSTTNNSLSYILLTWTPQANQIGSQELCVYAYNNLFLRSTQYCVTFTVITSTPSCPITTTTISTESPNIGTNDINLPFIIGLSLLALMLSCCCCCCCWLYYFFCGAAARRRRARQDKENFREQKYVQSLRSIITRKNPFKIFRKSCVSNAPDSEHIIRLNTPTSSSCTPKTQVSTKNIDQSFPKENTWSKPSHHQNNEGVKLSRNKVSIIDNVNDNQKKDRINTITASNTIIAESNISMHQDKTATIRKIRIIKVKAPKPITEERSPKINAINVTKVKRLHDNIQPKKSHEDSGERINNKVTVISIPRRKT